MANRINYTIGYTVDKTGLQQLQSLFQTIAFQAQEPGNKMNAGLQQAGKTATQLDAILEKCFNQDLGTLNVTRFNQELKKANLTTSQIKTDLAGAGATGAMAFNNLGSSILKTNIQLKQTNKLLDSMAVSMANTVKWGITSSIFNTVTSSISKSVNYAKQLDKSLNNIRIVTGKSKDEMAEFAVEANNAAKSLSASTLDYTNASLIYAQQGLSDAEVKARAEVTVKAANVTGQTGEEVSEQLTAVWNGYKVTAAETELYVDKLAAVAASTAADLEELSTGMSKVAAAANSMGVDIDQLNAQLSTIVSVTRQAPESAGTALKTIYARMADLKLGETDEDGVGLGEVSAEMTKIGVNVLDANGNLKDMGDVVEEVAEKWDKLSKAQQVSIASAMAGKRQYNNLIALFDNWDMYTEALETSQNAMGTLQKQQDIYLESTPAKLKELKATWEDLYGSLIDNDELNTGIDGLKNLVQVFDNFIDSFGGGIKAIGAFGAIVANIFNKQISNAIIHARVEQQKYQNNIQVLEAQRNAMQQSLMQTSGGQETIQSQANAIAYQKQLDLAKQIYAVRQGITSEQYNEYMQEAAIIKEETEKATLIELQMKKKLDNAGYNDKEIQNLIQELGLYDSEYQKVNDIIGLLEVQEVLSARIKKIKESNLSTEEKGKQIAHEILDVNQNITGAYLEKYRLSTAGLTNVKDEAKLQDRIRIILQNIEKWNKQDYKITKDKSEALNFMAENMEKYSDAQSRATAGVAGLSQNIEQASKNLSVFKTIGTVLPVVSNLAMSWSSVSMAMQTLNDESTSLGDKITQIAMTASMTIPMLIHTFTQMNNTLGYTTGLSATWAALKERHNILDSLSITKTQFKNGLEQAARINQEKYNIALQQEAQFRNISISQLSLERRAFIMVNVARAQGISLTQEQALATLKAKGAQDKLNASMLKNPWMWLVAGIGLVIGAISKMTEEYKKAKEAKLEEIESNLNKLETLQAEQKETEELVDNYLNLYYVYKQTGEVTDDLVTASEAVIKALGLENATIETLTGNYESLTKKIIESQKAALNRDLDTAKSALGEAQSGFIDEATDSGLTITGYKDFDYWSPRLGYSSWSSDDGETDVVEIIREEMEKQGLKGSRLAQSESGTASITIYDEQERIAFYKALKAAYDRIDSDAYQDSEVYADLKKLVQDADLNKWFGKILAQESLIKEIESQMDMIDLGYQDEILNIQNASEYENLYNKILNQLIEANSTEDGELKEGVDIGYLEAQVEDYIGGLIGSDAIVDYKTRLSATEQISGIIGSNIANNAPVQDIIDYFRNQDSNVISSGVTMPWEVEGSEAQKEQYAVDKSFEIKEDVANEINKLSSQEFSILMTLGIDKLSSLENLQDYIEIAKKKAEVQDIKINLQIIDSASETLLKNEELTEEQIKELEKLEQQYPKLATIQDKQSKTYLENLLQIQEALEEEEEILNQQIENSYITQAIDIDITANEEDFLQKMKEIAEADYEVIVSIKGDIQTNFDNVISTMTNIDTLASKIGEDFIVAAEDIEELNNAFPGILEGITFLKDGTAQLNAEVVENAMNAAKTEVTYDTQATVQKLQNDILELESRRDAAREIAKIAGEQVGQEQINADVESKIDNALNTLKSDNSTEVTTQEKEENQDVTETAKINAEIMANNYAEAYQKMTKDSATWAEATKNNILYAVTGGFFGTLNDGADTFETEWSASKTAGTVSSAEKADLSTYEDYASEEDLDWKAIEDYYTNLADSYDESINNTEGKIAELLARNAKSINSYENIESGKGNEEDQDERNEEKKNYDDEFDRYWQLNKIIDKTTESIDDLQNAQDNLFGEELQANLAKTNGLLDTQIANYQALYAEQQKEAAELRTILSQSGAAFDATGALTNYAAITEQALATYNQAVQAYNAHLIDDAAFETATTAYETFVENLERYDDLFYGEMIDTINEIEDREREKLENALSGWEAVIEVNLDEDSMVRDWNDFISEMNKDFTREFEDIGAELQRIATDVEYFPSTIHTDLNAINTVMQEMNNLQAGLGSTMFESVSQAEEKLRELTEQLMSDAEEMKGLYEEAWDAYLEGIDQAAEKLEKVMQEFENIDAELEYQGELIELIYGPEAYDLMDSLYKGQQKNMFAQIQSLQTQYDTWKQMYEAAEEGSADQVKYYDLMNEAQANLNDSVIEYIELLKSEYSNTVSDILKKVEKEIIGGSTFDDVEKQWDRLMEKSDKYLDNLEGLYEIQSIANDTQAEIADMSDLKDQQKLQTLLDKELKQLREKDRLTKYDLDAAKARLEIAKAEIALEDARASKTSMRLTRGDDGNWSYQYVADADNVASKQQELMDAMNDYYQLTKDAHQESLESMMDLQIKLKEELEEIANSEVLTEEEKYAKMQEIQAYYEEQMTLLAEENELYKQNLAAATAGLAWNLYSQDAINFEAMTAAEQSLIQGLETTMVTSYNNIMTAATTDFATIELAVVENINDIGAAADNVATINIPAMTSAAQEMANRWSADDGTGIKATITGAIESIKTAMGQYQTKVDGVAKEVGEDFGKQGIQGAIEGATTATQTLICKVKELCGKEVLNGLGSFKNYVDDIAEAWGDVKTKIDESTTALDGYIKKKADENKKENTSGSGAGTKPSSTPTTPSTPAPSQPTQPTTLISTQGNGVINTGDKVTLKSGGKLATNSYDTPTLSTPYAGKQLYIQNIVDTSRRAPYHLGTTKDGKNNSSTWVGWVNKDQISGYDTGGYTGEWGSTGRMAFLHEKELILNKEDTKNILAAVNGIRQFSSVESAITKGIASMIMNMAGMSVNANYNTNEAKGNQTEQVFNITAEFPNANNVSEIREAILSLPGLASQQVGLNLI